MSSEANPKLLALLEKLVHPVEECNVTLDVAGVFAFPEEWKTIDEANPFFAYSVKLGSLEVKEGKILPRQLTEKELREQEEAIAKKKGTKKDDKKLTPAELEEIKKKQEEEEAIERKIKAEWDALDEETRFILGSEDKYKSASIRWEAGNTVTLDMTGHELEALEQCIEEKAGDWLYVVKYPNVPEDEVQKLKKGKLKGLTANDVAPLVMRGWFSFKDHQVPGCSESTQRIKLEYAPDEGAPVERSRPDLSRCYALVKVTTLPPINPHVDEPKPPLQELLPEELPLTKLPTTQEVIESYKGELHMSIEALSLEYANMFGKETAAHESKAKGIISMTQKKELRESRRERFLIDFNVSGKYQMLKERLKKPIIKIVRDHFQKRGSVTGLSQDQRDQIFTNLYVYLIEQMRTTMAEIIKEKGPELHEDIVATHEQYAKERDHLLNEVTKESLSDKLYTLASQAEDLNLYDLAEKKLKGALKINIASDEDWYKICEFYLRRGQFAKAEEALMEAMKLNDGEKDYVILYACLLMRRGRKTQANQILTKLHENHAKKYHLDNIINLLLAFQNSLYFKEAKISRKYFSVSQRIFHKEQAHLPPADDGSKMFFNPTASKAIKQSPTPNVTQVATPLLIDTVGAKRVYDAMESPTRKPEGPNQSDINDKIWLQLLEYFKTNGLYELAEVGLGLIVKPDAPEVMEIKVHIEKLKGNLQGAVRTIDELINMHPRHQMWLLQKGDICFKADKFYECEEAYLNAIQIKTLAWPANFQIFLRLGYIYLRRKSWLDAKNVLLKACELMKESPFAWLGVGIACTRLGQFKEAEEALTQANINDPLNAEAWGYLALMCLYDNGRVIQATQALHEMFRCGIQQPELIEEIADEFIRCGKSETGEMCLVELLKLLDHPKLGDSLTNKGTIHLKLAKLCHSDGRVNDAVTHYQEAYNHIEGENEKKRIQSILETLS